MGGGDRDLKEFSAEMGHGGSVAEGGCKDVYDLPHI